MQNDSQDIAEFTTLPYFTAWDIEEDAVDATKVQVVEVENSNYSTSQQVNRGTMAGDKVGITEDSLLVNGVLQQEDEIYSAMRMVWNFQLE